MHDNLKDVRASWPTLPRQEREELKSELQDTLAWMELADVAAEKDHA